MNGPIGGRVVASSDQDRVTLGNRQRNNIGSEFLRVGLQKDTSQSRPQGLGGLTYAVDFNNLHVVAINPEEKCRKCGGIDYPQPVCLARREWESSVIVKARQIFSACIRKVDQTRILMRGRFSGTYGEKDR